MLPHSLLICHGQIFMYSFPLSLLLSLVQYPYVFGYFPSSCLYLPSINPDCLSLNSDQFAIQCYLDFGRVNYNLSDFQSQTACRNECEEGLWKLPQCRTLCQLGCYGNRNPGSCKGFNNQMDCGSLEQASEICYKDFAAINYNLFNAQGSAKCQKDCMAGGIWPVPPCNFLCKNSGMGACTGM